VAGCGVRAIRLASFPTIAVFAAEQHYGFIQHAHNLVFQLAAETGVAGLLVLFVSLGVWLYGLRHAKLDAAHWWGHAALGVLAIHSLLEYPLWYTYFVRLQRFCWARWMKLATAWNCAKWTHVDRVHPVDGVADIDAIAQVAINNWKEYWRYARHRVPTTAHFERTRDGLVAVHGGSLLSPYAELFMSSLIEVKDERIREKLELNTRVMLSCRWRGGVPSGIATGAGRPA